MVVPAVICIVSLPSFDPYCFVRVTLTVVDALSIWLKGEIGTMPFRTDGV